MPAPQWIQQPRAPQPVSRPQPTRAPAAPPAQALQQRLPPPPPAFAPAQVVRAKVDDPAPVTPPPAAAVTASLRLPAPEQLGVGGAAPEVDWNATHAELRRLGAVSVQLAQLPTGGYRFTCVLPTGAPDRTRRVEATGASEAEVVRLALTAVAEAR